MRYAAAALAVLLIALAPEPPTASAISPTPGYPGAATFTSNGAIRGEPSFTTDYGADNTGTNDCTTALASFLSSTQRALFIPAGTFRFDFSATHDGNDVARDVTITGAGEGSTTIVVGPYDLANYAWWLRLTAACHVTLSGLKVVGPTSPTYNANIETSPWNSFVRANAVNSTSPTRIDIDHCRWETLTHAVFVYGGSATSPTTVNITNCHGSAWAQNVTFYRGAGTAHLLKIRDTDFRRWGKGPSSQDYGHNVYVHSHVGIDIARCYFANAAAPTSQNAIHHGGGSTSVPALATISACQFEAGGSLIMDGTAPTTITGCELNDVDAWHRFGDQGIVFEDSTLKGATVYGPSNGGEITMDGCTLAAGDWYWESNTDLYVVGGTHSGGTFKFYGSAASSWSGTTLSGGRTYYITGYTGAHAYSSCTFSGHKFYEGPGYTETTTPQCGTCQ